MELLKYGRHFRIGSGSKIIVGRNNADNEEMQKLSTEDDLILFIDDFPGPHVLVPYGDKSALPIAASLCVRYSDAPTTLKLR